MTTQKVRTFLWFDDDALQAAELYVSVIPNSKITHVEKGDDGKPFLVELEIGGVQHMLLNGGPHHAHSEAASLFVTCDTQAEVDTYWAKLTANGGSESQCGWLKDRFGVSWQICPRQLLEFQYQPDKAKRKRVVDAMLKMKKIDIATLERAAAG